MSFYTRKEIAVLTGRTEKNIGQMSYRGKVPGRTIVKSGHKRIRYCYDKKIIDDWIENLPDKSARSDGYVKKTKATTQGTITFKQVFAGQFERRELKNRWGLKKLCAKHSNPKTVTVKVIGEW